jgi:tetratricopeptide (TPR) repeat protein
MRQGYYKQSEALFAALIDKSPEFSRAHLGLAISYDRGNKPNDALALYEQLITLKSFARNRDFIESRINFLRKQLGRRPQATKTGNVLIRVK